MLWAKFQAEKASLRNKLGKESRIERLWHGHNTTPVEMIINGEEGFDMRFARISGAFGQGNYFAINAYYSA